MFTYCPSCASTNIRFEDAHVFKCPDCGFVYYHNTAASTALIIDSGNSIMFVRRGKEPAAGKLDFPGGFVDPREGAIDGLIRECREEIGWTPERGALSLFASFPNVYPYKNIVYNTCDLFFSICLDIPPEKMEKMFSPQQKEIASIVFAGYDKINLDDIAFDSTRAAADLYLKLR
ncbi:MAG: NUDIX domain-containing protein [Spirochaetaceae bacterium]|jgi:ADP-ribose pyrophosphatase YjhB (NUDIX family)|nr:NUDIX domain-containing protein [Spirochaetaceae bacterium]